jgi:histone-lysine N-methyltransferase SETMAR
MYSFKGLVVQILVPKGRTVAGKYYRDVILRKLKKNCKRRRPQTVLKYLRLLHDNASGHKARIVTDFFKAEEVTALPHPAFSPDLAPCNYFLFPNLKFHPVLKKIHIKKCSGLCHLPVSFEYTH